LINVHMTKCQSLVNNQCKSKRICRWKGANQAVAAVRSGAVTSFIGQVGDDGNGKFMIDALENDGINTDHVAVDKVEGTGSAVILLDSQGQNSIMVYGGANQAMKPAMMVDAEPLIENADILISEFETPQDVTYEAFKLAKQHGVTTILNPAPAAEIIDGLLEVTDLIVPNETESASLTGIEVTDNDSMDRNAEKICPDGDRQFDHHGWLTRSLLSHRGWQRLCSCL